LPMDGFPSDGVLNNDHLGTLTPFGAPSTPSFRGDVEHGSDPTLR
jgi:hypothetical protein